MNPVVLAVCLMLILSLARVHVVFSLIISAFIGGMVADIPAETILAAFPAARPFLNTAAAGQALAAHLADAPATVVLVKGSRSARMEGVLAAAGITAPDGH